jgi:hypothetical protein
MTSIITPTEIVKFQKKVIDYRPDELVKAIISEANRLIGNGSFDTIIDEDGTLNYEIKVNSVFELGGITYEFKDKDVSKIGEMFDITKKVKEPFEDAGWGYCYCDHGTIRGYGYIRIKLYPDVPSWYKKKLK